MVRDELMVNERWRLWPVAKGFFGCGGAANICATDPALTVGSRRWGPVDI